jgi:hypothetical protein
VTKPQQLPQLALLDRVVQALRASRRMRAAFLRGSFYSGTPDAYSEIDLFAVAKNGESEEHLALGREVLSAAGQLLSLSTTRTYPPRLRALFAGPTRLNLTIVTAETLPPFEGWRVLFDDEALLRDRPLPEPPREPLLPDHVTQVCDEFWWNMFDGVGQIKRGQLWMALNVLDTCRASLAQMMRWRRDPEQPTERFAKLERHLTAEDQQALVQTLATYDPRSIAKALLCAADAFDPAARDVAARVGAEYPAALAHETKAFFIRVFWALLAPGPAISA